MHLWPKCVLTSALLLAVSVSGLEYVILAPNIIRSDSKFPVSVLVHNATSDVHIDVALVGKPTANDGDTLVFKNSAVVQTDKLAVMEIDVGDLSSLVSGSMACIVNGSDSSDSFRTSYGPLTISTTTTAENPKNSGEPLVFIQTDKPVYSPNDTVRFRVVSVKRVGNKLMPVFVPFYVQILDWKCNVVQQFSNANDTRVAGYFAGEVPLSAYLQNAGWSIRAVVRAPDDTNNSLGNPSRDFDLDPRCDPSKEPTSVEEELIRRHTPRDPSDPVLASKIFLIESYPKSRFEVRIVTPKTYYVPSIDGEFRFEVIADYTPGESVIGKFDVRVSRPRYEDGVYVAVWNQSISPGQFRSISVPAQTVMTDSDEFDTKVIIEVDFTEVATGHQEQAKAIVVLRTEAYIIKINAGKKTFLPGYPFWLTATISDWDGRPPPPSTKKVQVDVFYYVYDSLGQSKRVSLSGGVSCAGQRFPPSYGGGYGSGGYGGNGYGGDGYGSGRGYGRKKRSLGFGSSWYGSNDGCNALPDTQFAEIHADGTVYFDIAPPKNAGEVAITVAYEGKVDAVSLLAKQSPSGSFLEILQESELIAGEVAESRAGHFVMAFVPIAEAMGLAGRLIVYYVASDGELVGNIMALSVVDDRVGLSVHTELGQPHAMPGEEISLHAYTTPSAFVAFLALDENLARLRMVHDITFNIKPTDSGPVQQFLLTNTKLPATVPRWGHFLGYSTSRSGYSGADVDGSSKRYTPASYADDGYFGDDPERIFGSNYDVGFQKARPINYNFQQSFLFATATADDQGVAVIKRKVPDAMASWYIFAFSLSNTSGLTVLPEPRRHYAALNVTVLLKIRLPDNTTVAYTKKVLSKPKEPVIAAFSIVPEQAGELNLQVTARADFEFDQVEKRLVVKQEGVTQYYSKPILIDLRNSTKFDAVLTLPVSPPGKFVGSDKVAVNVVGDILGISTRNLDKLIRLPLGCGENSLALMAPSVTVWKYLEKTGKLSAAKRQELEKSIQIGYQRSLMYQHQDFSFGAWASTQPNGSFFAWSASDENGSTWLTARIAKVFAEASQLVSDVDETVVQKMFAFLIDKQREDGHFEESGQILDKGVQSGDSKDVSLTGLCVLAFVQYIDTGKANVENLGDSMQKAVMYLESQLEGLGNDSFALAVASYALAKANSQRKLDALTLLSERMVANYSTIHWTTGSTGQEVNMDAEMYSTDAKDVEATSYALLAYIANGKLSTATKIASWLISKQNANGGFFSTADTVVALQALAEFAVTLGAPSSVQIDIIGGAKKSSFAITPKTSLDVQSTEFPTKPENVVIHAKGTGVGVVSLSWIYNINQPKETAAFDLTATYDIHAKQIGVNLCATYLRDGASSMAVMEIEALSGYQFDEREIDKLPKEIQPMRKAELSNKDSKLNLYFDEVTTSGMCFRVTMYRLYKVENLQNQTIVIYDYFNPKDRRMVSYDGPSHAF
ncbi:CD109 antigen-like [Paramacrobiotus metropolitanus]|uniref:CD109 antigen-like n=1 Tax=Paramacrobiotus metropolitanus TaxID=2943436 RepID=UPI0024458371|nr:CD109 antigen-like [Paramacrobiotus metropolitanus]